MCIRDRDCQTAIDKMNHAMDENVLLSAKQRYVLSDTAGVNLSLIHISLPS